jgi:hypothetical protein
VLAKPAPRRKVYLIKANDLDSQQLAFASTVNIVLRRHVGDMWRPCSPENQQSNWLAKRRRVEEAYEHVMTDPTFKQRTRLKGTHVSLETKRFIVEMYEKLTERNLLKGA